MSEEGETLVERIARKSEAEAASLLATARRVAERQVQSAGRRASTRERLAGQELDARIGAARARAEAEARGQAVRMKLVRRHELAERVLAAALEKLAGEPRDDSYVEVLTRLTCEAAAGLSAREAFLCVSASDREFLTAEDGFGRLEDAVERTSEVTLTLSDETVAASGGVVLRTADGRVSYYNTFEEIAYRMGPQLRQMTAEELFG